MLQHSITHHVPSRCYNSGRGGMAVGTRGCAAAIGRSLDAELVRPPRTVHLAGYGGRPLGVRPGAARQGAGAPMEGGRTVVAPSAHMDNNFYY